MFSPISCADVIIRHTLEKELKHSTGSIYATNSTLPSDSYERNFSIWQTFFQIFLLSVSLCHR